LSCISAHFALHLLKQPVRYSTDECFLFMQLAIDNTLAPYLGSQFGFSTNKAANLASIFGMMNFWARPLGGFLSDIVGRRYETKSEACLLEPSLSPVLTLLFPDVHSMLFGPWLFAADALC